jgi:hypothetical protein
MLTLALALATVGIDSPAKDAVAHNPISNVL